MSRAMNDDERREALAFARHHNVLATTNLDLTVEASPVPGEFRLVVDARLPWEDVLRLQRAIDLVRWGGTWRNATPCLDDCLECAEGGPRYDEGSDPGCLGAPH